MVYYWSVSRDIAGISNNGVNKLPVNDTGKAHNYRITHRILNFFISFLGMLIETRRKIFRYKGCNKSRCTVSLKSSGLPNQTFECFAHITYSTYVSETKKQKKVMKRIYQKPTLWLHVTRFETYFHIPYYMNIERFCFTLGKDHHWMYGVHPLFTVQQTTNIDKKK